MVLSSALPAAVLTGCGVRSDYQQRQGGVISCPFYVPVVYFPSVSQERGEQSLTALTVLLFCSEIIVSQHELKRDCCPWEGEKKHFFLEANKCHVHGDDSARIITI